MAAPSARRRLRAIKTHLIAGAYDTAAHEPSVTTLLPAGVPMQPVGGGHTHPQITCTLDGTLVVVCAAVLDNESPGKDCLICFRSEDAGISWSEPTQIAPTHFKPTSVTSLGGTGDFECYPGTLTTLPDGRLLLTWTYNGINLPPVQQAKAVAPKGGGVGAGHPGGGDHGAFLYALSSDNGQSWSDATEVSDPGGPQESFLGTSRHGVLPWSDGRWLIVRLASPFWLLDHDANAPLARCVSFFPARSALAIHQMTTCLGVRSSLILSRMLSNFCPAYPRDFQGPIRQSNILFIR